MEKRKVSRVIASVCGLTLAGLLCGGVSASGAGAARDRELARKDPEAARQEAERRIAKARGRLLDAGRLLAGEEALRTRMEHELGKAQRAHEDGDSRGALTFVRRVERLLSEVEEQGDEEGQQ